MKCDLLNFFWTPPGSELSCAVHVVQCPHCWCNMQIATSYTTADVGVGPPVCQSPPLLSSATFDVLRLLHVQYSMHRCSLRPLCN